MNPDNPTIESTSDCFVSVRFRDEINPDINNKVHTLFNLLKENSHFGITGLIPSYNSILIQYNPSELSNEHLIKIIEQQLSKLESELTKQTVIDIPVLYGDIYGEDLEFVAEHTNLTPDQVIEIHSTPKYLVYMLGFTPGFPYLGGMEESISTPRLTTPRTLIPAGSVGIADKQTGIYPSESPGGWQLIGKTPLILFNHEKYPPSLITPGDLIRFVPLNSIDEYETIFNLVKTDKFKPNKSINNEN